MLNLTGSVSPIKESNITCKLSLAYLSIIDSDQQSLSIISLLSSKGFSVKADNNTLVLSVYIDSLLLIDSNNFDKPLLLSPVL